MSNTLKEGRRTVIQVNVIGSGPVGPRGPQGVQGEQGVPGATGPDVT